MNVEKIIKSCYNSLVKYHIQREEARLKREVRVRNTRNSMIDILRVFFAIMIALFHIQEIYPVHLSGKIIFFTEGAIAVEFFALVSGFLMAQTARRKINNGFDGVGKETAGYVLKKYIRVFPYHFFAYMVSLILFLQFNSPSLFDKVKSIFFSFGDLFLLNMTGMVSLNLNVPAWYLSSLFIVLLVVYPLIRYNYDLFVHVIAPVFVLCVLGWMSHSTESMRGVMTWVGFLYKGTLRVAAGLILGCICFEVCRLMQNHRAVFFKYRIQLSLIEIGGYIFTVVYSCMKLSQQGYFIVIFILAVSITLTFSGLTVTKNVRIIDKKSYLEKFSIAIFLNQIYCLTITGQLVWRMRIELSNIAITMLYFIMVILSSWLCVFVVEHAKKRWIRWSGNERRDTDNTV